MTGALISHRSLECVHQTLVACHAITLKPSLARARVSVGACVGTNRVVGAIVFLLLARVDLSAGAVGVGDHPLVPRATNAISDCS